MWAQHGWPRVPVNILGQLSERLSLMLRTVLSITPWALHGCKRPTSKSSWIWEWYKLHLTFHTTRQEPPTYTLFWPKTWPWSILGPFSPVLIDDIWRSDGQMEGGSLDILQEWAVSHLVSPYLIHLPYKRCLYYLGRRGITKRNYYYSKYSNILKLTTHLTKTYSLCDKTWARPKRRGR